MTSRCTFCILCCMFSLGHYGVSLKWHEKKLTGTRSYNNSEELTVNGKDLKICENHRNMCVMDPKDCASTSSPGQNRFLNTSCRYHVEWESFTCNWIFLSNVKAKTMNSFIFSQDRDFKYCPSIFNPLGAFNLNIISKDIINQVEVISETYRVSIKNISQAPRPVITSVNATERSVNVTWTVDCEKDRLHSTKCQIRYKDSTTEQWTEDSLNLPDNEEPEISHVIDGLQPFTQYNFSVACSDDYGLWSDWSEEFQRETLEDTPTAPPYVSFCVEPSGSSSKTRTLILIWKALEINEARGLICGYEVSYTPTKQPGLKRSICTKNQKAIIEVTASDYDVTVTAYNTAGRSPTTDLRVDAGVFHSLPKVTGLWASSEASSLRIQWETAAVNVSEFAIEWFPFGDVATKQWKRLNGSTFSTVLTDHIEPQKTYSITVYSLYGTLCSAPEAIRASLEYGTLLDIVQLQPVNVTKTSVTVQWVWKERSPTTNVLHYKLVLSGDQETTSLLVFPHQRQHSFYNLQTSVKYTVSVYGETTSGRFLRANIEFTTPRLESEEIIKATVPIVLLIVALGIFSVISRTVYKDYFFPNIANPGHSHIGHWLLNPPYEKENVLKLEDFTMTNQVTEKSIIHIEPIYREGFNEDMTMPKMSLPDNYTTENSDNLENSMTLPGFSDYVDLPLLHANFGYVKNCDMQLC